MLIIFISISSQVYAEEKVYRCKGNIISLGVELDPIECIIKVNDMNDIYKNMVTYRTIEKVIPIKSKITIAGYLAHRLVEAGLSHFFTVPGDFTLAMLDEFLKESNLKMISCCNELNAGYAGILLIIIKYP